MTPWSLLINWKRFIIFIWLIIRISDEKSSCENYKTLDINFVKVIEFPVLLFV